MPQDERSGTKVSYSDRRSDRKQFSAYRRNQRGGISGITSGDKKKKNQTDSIHLNILNDKQLIDIVIC